MYSVTQGAMSLPGTMTLTVLQRASSSLVTNTSLAFMSISNQCPYTHTHTHTHTWITKEIWISLCLPATNSAVSRKAKPNARSLSHRYMVISGNQPNSRETACVLLKGKIMVISEPVFLCWAESRRREVNAYSSTGVLSDRGGFLLLPWEQTTCCEAVMSDSVLLTSPKGLQRVLFAGSQESCSKSLPRPLTSLIQVDWVTRLLKRFSLKKDAFFVSK